MRRALYGYPLPNPHLWDALRSRFLHCTSLGYSSQRTYDTTKGVLQGALAALALLMLPVLLALGPILIAPSGPDDHGNQNRSRHNGDDNETDAGCYSDAQGADSANAKLLRDVWLTMPPRPAPRAPRPGPPPAAA